MTLDRRHALGALVLLAVVTIGRLEWRRARPQASHPTTSVPALTAVSVERRPSEGMPGTLIAPALAVEVAPPDGERPHPITPEHERIFRENRLIGAMNGAMDVEDAEGLRRLLAEYRQEYPEDDQELSDGYAVIADCLDAPGAEARAAAERWAEEHRGSTLRRFVLRHCLSR